MLDDIRDELNPRTASVAVVFFLVAVLLCVLQAAAHHIYLYFARRGFVAKDVHAVSGVGVDA
jgi:hypothetical protein